MSKERNEAKKYYTFLSNNEEPLKEEGQKREEKTNVEYFFLFPKNIIIINTITN